MPVLHDWQNFYMLTGTASATLIGLLFVAISISMGTHLSLQQTMASLRTFVEPTLWYYVQALAISCVATMPLPNPVLLLGVLLLVLAALDLFLTGRGTFRMRVLDREDARDARHWIWYMVFPLFAGILSISTALGLLLGVPFALLGISMVDLLCLAIGLHNSWVLTVWLIQQREGWFPSREEPQFPQNDDGPR
jgi:hypothetical protein